VNRHPHVPHPRECLAAERTAFTAVNRWLTSALGSNVTFLACFLVPLLAVPASEPVKLVVGIVFSNWFQAWALPVLQKGQAQADLKRDAKADADHLTFTHLATAVDALHEVCLAQDARLARIEAALATRGRP